jgi:hypothetical protein
MWRWRRFLVRFYSFFRPAPAERELEREIASHLRLLEDEFQSRGMTPGEANLVPGAPMAGLSRPRNSRETSDPSYGSNRRCRICAMLSAASPRPPGSPWSR